MGARFHDPSLQKRAPLKTPAWVAKYKAAQMSFLSQYSVITCLQANLLHN